MLFSSETKYVAYLFNRPRYLHEYFLSLQFAILLLDCQGMGDNKGQPDQEKLLYLIGLEISTIYMLNVMYTIQSTDLLQLQVSASLKKCPLGWYPVKSETFFDKSRIPCNKL